MLVIFVLIFAVELLKYWYVYEKFYGGKINNKWLAYVAITLYTIILFLFERNNEVMYLIMYLGVLLTIGFTIAEKISRKIIDTLALLCILSGLDEVFGIIFENLSLHELQIMEETMLKLLLASLSTFGIIISVQAIRKFLFQIINEKYQKIIKETIHFWIFLMVISMLFATATLAHLRDYLKYDKELYALTTMLSILSYISICALSFFVIYFKQSNNGSGVKRGNSKCGSANCTK